jgi:hypothetical protein
MVMVVPRIGLWAIAKEAEIIIVPKQETKLSQLKTFDFIAKWSAFLTNINTDDLKYQYLTDKYK